MGKMLVLLLGVWLLVLVFLTGPLLRSSDTEEALAKKLLEAQKEVSGLRRERDALKRNLRDSAGAKQGGGGVAEGPSKEYEEARRRSYRDLKELWYFLKSKLESLVTEKAALSSVVPGLVASVEERQSALAMDLLTLQGADGYSEWREEEASSLSALVQARLKWLQNPSDCSKARKLLCNLNKGCGYGCQVHHAVYCFLVAYGTQRTLILNSKGWRYNKKGFEDVFLPLSETCTDPGGSSRANWPGKADTQVVELPIVDSVSPRPPFLPPSVPKDLVDRIATIHGDPIVWWVSQFLLYLLRPQPHLSKLLSDTMDNFNFEHPIVGIHVRRTDKVGTEAAFHPVEEYMGHVLEWWREYELMHGTQQVKRVYVASDDPKVLGECRKKYPSIEFLGDQSVAKSAAVSSRYTDSSLRGVIQDIHLLSQTDFLVCTFSSQVCRIAYEIMQQGQVDASSKFRSLDDIWYYGGQEEHQQEAVLRHQPSSASSGEMSLEVGDVLGVAGNHWDGFNKGRNHRTNRIGLYPQFKAKEKLRVVDFPKYEQVKVPPQDP